MSARRTPRSPSRSTPRYSQAQVEMLIARAAQMAATAAVEALLARADLRGALLHFAEERTDADRLH